MTPTIRLILIVLVCYRLSYMVTKEDGPFRIFKIIQIKFGVMSANDRKSRIKKFFADLSNCPYCLGIWISPALSLLYFFPTIIGDGLLVVGGIAAGQHFLQRLVGFEE